MNTKTVQNNFIKNVCKIDPNLFTRPVNSLILFNLIQIDQNQSVKPSGNEYCIKIFEFFKFFNLSRAKEGD